jgi:hypothetical protein
MHFTTGLALQPASTHLTLLRWQCGNLLRRHLGKPLHERLPAACRANSSPRWHTPGKVLSPNFGKTRLHPPEDRTNVDRAAFPRFPRFRCRAHRNKRSRFEALVLWPHPRVRSSLGHCTIKRQPTIRRRGRSRTRSAEPCQGTQETLHTPPSATVALSQEAVCVATTGRIRRSAFDTSAVNKTNLRRRHHHRMVCRDCSVVR